MKNYDWLQELAAGKPPYNPERKRIYEAYFKYKYMDLNGLDDILNNIESYPDAELIILYNHSIDMQYKYQQTGDNSALQYWSDLAKIIICQKEKRRLVHV